MWKYSQLRIRYEFKMNYISRRNFIRKSGVTIASGLLASRIPAMANTAYSPSVQQTTDGIYL
ncbi:MAG: twin-arginine translocation signal domain-containing protein [Tannerella sp.]|nr:twin-arginine translocation signal domain-containing protein [Tannerella sp.]